MGDDDVIRPQEVGRGRKEDGKRRNNSDSPPQLLGPSLSSTRGHQSSASSFSALPLTHTSSHFSALSAPPTFCPARTPCSSSSSSSSPVQPSLANHEPTASVSSPRRPPPLPPRHLLNKAEISHAFMSNYIRTEEALERRHDDAGGGAKVLEAVLEKSARGKRQAGDSRQQRFCGEGGVDRNGNGSA